MDVSPLPPLHVAALAGSAEGVQSVLAAGNEVDAPAEWDDRKKVTPLMLAASRGHTEIISLLLAAGAKVTAKDASGHEDGGQSAIHYAAAGGHFSVIELLRKAGAKVNASTRDGRTPLFEAIAAGQTSCALALLGLGADPNAGLPDQPLCLELALAAGAKDVVAELKRRKAKRIPPEMPSDLPLAVAVRHGSPAILRAFLRHGATKTFQKARWLEWAMMEAISESFGRPECAEQMLAQLLQAGADPNFSDEGEPALMSAVRGKGAAIGPLRLLLAAGARADVRDASGETPLMGAVQSFSPEKIQLLLEAGASVNLAVEGRTALDMALEEAPKMKYGEKILQQLRAAGAKTGAELRTAGVPAEDFVPKDEDDADFERPDFRAAAVDPAFLAQVSRLSEILGIAAAPMDHVPGGFTFAAGARDTCADLVTREQASFLAAGAFLFRSHRNHSGGADEVALFPTRRWQDVLFALETNGANEQIFPPDVVAWLENLERTCPFDLLGAGNDWLEGRFRQPVTNAKALAKQMYKFCPDIVDQGTGTVGKLAKDLEATQELFFWWD